MYGCTREVTEGHHSVPRLDHHATSRGTQEASRAGEDRSLTQGTAGAALGGPTGEHPHHEHDNELQGEYEGQRHGVRGQEVAR